MVVLLEFVSRRGLPRKRIFIPVGTVGFAALVFTLFGQGSRVVTVGMALIEVIRKSTVDREILHRLQFEREGVVVRMAFEVIGVLVDQRTRGIYLLSVVVQRVVRIVRFEHRREVLRTAVPGRTADRGFILVVVPPGIRTRIADLQPLEQLAFEVDAPRETLLSAVLDDTLGVVVGERSVIGRLIVGP